LVKITTLEALKSINSKINDFEQNSHIVSAISGLKIFKPIVNLNEDEDDYKLKLHNFDDTSDNENIIKQLELDLYRLNITFVKQYYSQRNLVYKLSSLVKNKVFDLTSCLSFDTIFSIEPMPKPLIQIDQIDSDSSFPIEYPIPNIEYPIIGVLDGGIEPIDNLKPWLHPEKFNPYDSQDINTSHGTFIAGIIVYGDLLENRILTGTGRFKVLDACVIPDLTRISINEYELIENIENAIKKYSNIVKIWTMSISITKEVSDNAFSDFAMALDRIQDQYNIIIFKSAGNTQNYNIRNDIDRRIHHGADSVRSITVGSAAHVANENSISSLYNVSPFSRVGRGPASIIKPEIVHFGGNIETVEGKNIAQGVTSFSVSGSLATAIGTSHSTPRASTIGAELLGRLDFDFDRTLIKSLILHSSKYLSISDLDGLDVTKYIGYGIPQVIENVLYNDPFSSTLILRDTIINGNYIDIFEFPMPDCLLVDGFFTGNISLTLCYEPLLLESQGSEYCQSDIDIKFGTYDKIKERDIKKNNILNRFGREFSQNVLLSSLYSKHKLYKDYAEHLDEHSLIAYGDKYYPSKKYNIDLSKITDANKDKILHSSRKWFLYLRGIFRDHVVNLYDKTGEALAMKFSLVITISDPSRTKPVYDSVSQKLNEFNFISSTVSIKSEVQVKNE